MEDLRGELEAALAAENLTERMLGVVSVVGAALADLGVRPVVVGGLAVQYWTHGDYSTGDIDVLLPAHPGVGARLEQLGFVKSGRHWTLPRQPLFVEAPDHALSAHEETVEVRLPSGRTVSILRPEDVLMYRLHEFVATGHAGIAEQAVALLDVPDLDRRRLAERAEQEGLTGALAALDHIAERARAGQTLQPHELHDVARSLRE